MATPLFHLAFPVDDLTQARAFYCGVLGCTEGRSDKDWVDFNFYGHQIVAYQVPGEARKRITSPVDGDDVPVRHFGLVLPMPDTLQAIGIDELEQLLEQDAVEVLDVREKDERDEGYIAGSRHIPYRLVRAYRDELQNGRPVVTICNTGARAAVAASVLAAEGIDARPVLDGGVDDWQRRGHPLTAFRRCGSG